MTLDARRHSIHCRDQGTGLRRNVIDTTPQGLGRQGGRIVCKRVQFLKPEQIKRYNILRGYAEDPCKNIPAGHHPEMYRRHMGCN